jgi:hypothetical protein
MENKDLCGHIECLIGLQCSLNCLEINFYGNNTITIYFSVPLIQYNCHGSRSKKKVKMYVHLGVLNKQRLSFVSFFRTFSHRWLPTAERHTLLFLHCSPPFNVLYCEHFIIPNGFPSFTILSLPFLCPLLFYLNLPKGYFCMILSTDDERCITDN